MQSEWSYLARLVILNVRPEEVSVIIGAEFKRAHDVLEIKQGKRHLDPQAELTRFGWVLFGRPNKNRSVEPIQTQCIQTPAPRELREED